MEDVTTAQMALRIGLSLAIGLVLGIEREQHGRAAGMRTTMLVCVASAIVMVLSQHLFWESSQRGGDWRPDPARLAAGVLAGMGFLGAGVIMRQDQAIHGVTTAAVLWFSAILGMVFGSGYLLLGFAGFGIVFIALFVLPGIEGYIHADRYARLSVTSGLKGPTTDRIKQAVEGMGLGARLKPSALDLDAVSRLRTQHFEVKIKHHRLGDCQGRAVDMLARMPGVRSVRWA